MLCSPPGEKPRAAHNAKQLSVYRQLLPVCVGMCTAWLTVAYWCSLEWLNHLVTPRDRCSIIHVIYWIKSQAINPIPDKKSHFLSFIFHWIFLEIYILSTTTYCFKTSEVCLSHDRCSNTGVECVSFFILTIAIFFETLEFFSNVFIFNQRYRLSWPLCSSTGERRVSQLGASPMLIFFPSLLFPCIKLAVSSDMKVMNP